MVYRKDWKFGDKVQLNSGFWNMHSDAPEPDNVGIVVKDVSIDGYEIGDVEGLDTESDIYGMAYLVVFPDGEMYTVEVDEADRIE